MSGCPKNFSDDDQNPAYTKGEVYAHAKTSEELVELVEKKGKNLPLSIMFTGERYRKCNESKPIKLTKDRGTLTLKCTLSHKDIVREVSLILDTGAYLTMITPYLATLLGLNQKDETFPFKVSSPIGVEKGFGVAIEKIQVGEQFLQNFDVGVVPIHDIHGVDGLLGLNFLEKFNLEINFQHRTLTLNKFT